MENLLTHVKPLSEIISDIAEYVAVIENDNEKMKKKIEQLENQDGNQQILDSLPDVLVAQDIADYLHIGRNKVYELLKKSPEKGGILSFGSGRSVRCLKTDFVLWIKKQKVR